MPGVRVNPLEPLLLQLTCRYCLKNDGEWKPQEDPSRGCCFGVVGKGIPRSWYRCSGLMVLLGVESLF